MYPLFLSLAIVSSRIEHPLAILILPSSYLVGICFYCYDDGWDEPRPLGH